MSDLKTEQVGGQVRFFVKAVPAGSRTALCGVIGGMLKVKLAAPPEKGKANACLVEFLARRLGVKKNAVSIISGQTSPVKQIAASGVSKEAIGKLVNI